MLAQSLHRFRKQDCTLVWLDENRGETEARQFPVFALLFPEFDTFEAHFWVTPGNGAGFRAPKRQTPRYMDC
jgi:hypothetical protein